MTVERTHLGRYYADRPIGVMVIRGENVVLMGEIVRFSFQSTALPALIYVNAIVQDLDVEDEVPLQAVPLKELHAPAKQEMESRKKREAEKTKVLFEKYGFSKEGGEGDDY